MKASELRIGNWYNSVKFNVPVRCDLSDYFELYYRSDGAYSYPPIDEYFAPIPLTKEWLIKFGFETNGLHCMGKPIKNTDLTMWFNMDHNPKDDKYYFHSFSFQYVHQLQNLYFSLTGEELTI